MNSYMIHTYVSRSYFNDGLWKRPTNFSCVSSFLATNNYGNSAIIAFTAKTAEIIHPLLGWMDPLIDCWFIHSFIHSFTFIENRNESNADAVIHIRSLIHSFIHSFSLASLP